jgi:hypothetical protein
VKRHSHIALVAIFALAIHSLGFCGGAATDCTTSVCAAHQQNGSCHRHPLHSGQQSQRNCCVSAICLSGAELTGGKDASVGDVAMLLPAVLSFPSINLAHRPHYWQLFAWVHAPPAHGPIFLSKRTLLI